MILPHATGVGPPTFGAFITTASRSPNPIGRAHPTPNLIDFLWLRGIARASTIVTSRICQVC